MCATVVVHGSPLSFKLTSLARDEELVGRELWEPLEELLEHAVVVNRSARVVGSAPVVVAVAEAHALRAQHRRSAGIKCERATDQIEFTQNMSTRSEILHRRCDDGVEYVCSWKVD